MTWLHSERVLIDGQLAAASIRIESGTIAEIRAGAPVEGAEAVEGVLFPGLVDTHVHLNEPGRTAWEGVDTGTRAAAVGGITTVVDMPLNCIPVTTSRDALLRKQDAIGGGLHVDVGLWGGVVPGNDRELGPMLDAGARGFKAFLCHSGIDDFPASDEATLRRAMQVLAERRGVLLAHAELEGPLDGPLGAPQDYATYLASRPCAWEDAAVALLIRLVEETGCRTHIVHLSSASALPLLREAHARGLPITAETCPHYLCLRAEDVPRGATSWKCAPPIREDENRALLWEGLRDGTIAFVVSDHSPCTPDLKLPEKGDFLEAWGGIASLQLGLSSVWSEARARGFRLEDLGRWLSSAPAALAGMGDRGRIAVGARADLVLWDPDASWVVTEEALRFRHKVTPYLGRRQQGRVLRTWGAGAVVFDGEGVVSGRGALV